MKNMLTIAALGSLLALGAAGAGEDLKSPASKATTIPKESNPVTLEARKFLDRYQKQSAELATAAALASWKASTTGKPEDFDAAAAMSLAVCKYHSDPAAYHKVNSLLKERDQLEATDVRALEVAKLAYEGNQLPPDLLKAMVDLSTEIERLFKTHRAALDGKRVTDNDLLERMAKETDSAKRKEIWESMKQVGGPVAPKLIELAKLRNEAARKLGYRNYWEMMIRLQEHDPAEILAIFDELEKLTNEPFAKMKAELDGELAKRFGIEPGEMMPWHYDNPFFQAAPPSAKVDLDEFYQNKKKEEIVELARTFYAGLGMPIDDIVARSDLYEREGKDQHAFCEDMDRAGDVRTLLNIKPTAEWMDTMLHEQGHAVYSKYIDRSLPYNLRDAAHIFTTEGVAMFFGALAKTPWWLVDCAGADAGRVDEVAGAIAQQRRREQLIFARWALVMLHFEKALYENPDQDLNELWWDTVQRYQHLRRPPDRDAPDWASKTHFTVAPVYYHNYQLGELFAAQLRHTLAERLGQKDPASAMRFAGKSEVGEFFKEKVFAPGSIVRWPEYVRRVTGEPLTAKYFADEVQ